MSNQRFIALQQELSSILEERLQALTEAIRTTEAMTREVISTDLQIQKEHDKLDRLKVELSEHRTKLVEKENAVQIQQALLDNQQTREKELQSRLEQLQGNIHRLSQSGVSDNERIRDMELQQQRLQEENARNVAKIQTLQDNIEGMKRLQEQQMLSVMNLTSELHHVATGKPLDKE